MLAANVAFWLLSDATTHATLDAYVLQAAALLLDWSALAACYAQWLRWVMVASETFLADCHTSWHAVSEATLLWSLPDGSMRSPHPFTWENFVARARHRAVEGSWRLRKPRKRLRTENRPVTAFGLHSFTGTWRCVMRSIAMVPMDDQPFERMMTTPHRVDRPIRPLGLDDVPTAAVFAFWQQLSELQLRFDSDTRTLDMGAATRFVLDGQVRCFNAYPRGASTLGRGAVPGGQCFGDYVGSVTARGNLHVVCFSWPLVAWTHGSLAPTQAPTRAYRWECELKPAEMDERIVGVKLQVSVGSIGNGRDVGLACDRVHERIQRVPSWHELYRIRCPYVTQPDARREGYV